MTLDNLLNQASRTTFFIFQDSLWSEILLHISRLTDKKKTGKYKNLTICALPNLLKSLELQNQVEGLIKIANDNASFARDWRNRKLAHSDLQVALNKSIKPLLPASRLKVKEAIYALDKVLNAVSIHYFNSTTHYGDVEDAVDAIQLLYILEDGIRFQSERRNRLESGNYSKDDFVNRNI